ncbi:MAG: glycoside hydrolase family 5 protein [Chloroflexi bacterium]|nr:glycoside hydrolase family 5 protein [Chloroflexota bacterium]
MAHHRRIHWLPIALVVSLLGGLVSCHPARSTPGRVLSATRTPTATRTARPVPPTLSSTRPWTPTPRSAEATHGPPPSPTATPNFAMRLWQEGQVRGANVYQRRVYPELDGTTFYGPGPFGPPYTQADLDALAAQGANWVVLSVMGPYTVTPPYRPDEQALEHLARWVDRAWRAGLFVSLAIRAGPGRSEFSILREGVGDWFGPEYLHEEVWTDPRARRAWAAMWRLIAQRFRGHPAVIGYELMVEPNANDIVGVDDPQAFQRRYQGTGYDWNAWYPELIAAIRSVDPDTPILVSPLGYASPRWLAVLHPHPDPHVVYSVHLYAPHAYTHQGPDEHLPYPGWVEDDTGERRWLDATYFQAEARALQAFRARVRRPVVVTETGLVRWAPGAAAFMQDRLRALETYGLPYAIWLWPASWPPLRTPDGDHAFNFLLGPDPNHFTPTPNALWQTYQSFWARNRLRPPTPQP